MDQVVTVDSNTNEIRVNKALLERIAANIDATGVEEVAIVSIMGAYRTGKSFLFDLFLRYLRYNSRPRSAEEFTIPQEDNDDVKAVSDEESSNIPKWLRAEGDFISEGREPSAGPKGFQWRGGMEKCTQGIWIWSEPFVIRWPADRNSTDEEGSVAVLLLDSQGAFDSQMTKEQSATIFGLTAVLSSLQIYNVSMQLQEDKIESLHYFMECAGSCMRLVAADDTDNLKLFEHLEFLIRDWPNFEPGWELEACKDQMQKHLDQHFTHARDATTPDAIKEMFREITCWMLPHPGLKINKQGWDGRISDLDNEFIRFLDAYVHRTFGPDLVQRKILGRGLTASTFATVFETFTEAFKNLVPKSANLALAISRSTNLISKQEALTQYRQSIQNALPVGSSETLSADEFSRFEKRYRSAALDHFVKHSNFGPPEEREETKTELLAELETLRVHFENENKRRMEGTLTIFAGLTILVFVLYTIDRISDFTCDWYSDTCVRISNALFLIYFTIVVAILTNVYLLYHARGHAVTVVALIEMVKAAITLTLDYFSSGKKILEDWKDSKGENLSTDMKRLGQRIASDLKQGLQAIHVSFMGSILGRKSNENQQ